MYISNQHLSKMISTAAIFATAAFSSTLLTGCNSDSSDADMVVTKEAFQQDIVGRWRQCVNEDEGSSSYTLTFTHSEYVETVIHHAEFDCLVSVDDEIDSITFGGYALGEAKILDDGNDAFEIDFLSAVTQFDLDVDSIVTTTNNPETATGGATSDVDVDVSMDSDYITVDSKIDANLTVNVPPEIDADVDGFLSVFADIYTAYETCYTVVALAGGSLYFGSTTEQEDCSAQEKRPISLEENPFFAD